MTIDDELSGINLNNLQKLQNPWDRIYKEWGYYKVHKMEIELLLIIFAISLTSLAVSFVSYSLNLSIYAIERFVRPMDEKKVIYKDAFCFCLESIKKLCSRMLTTVRFCFYLKDPKGNRLSFDSWS